MRRNKNILLFLFLSIFIVFNTACTKENIDSNNSETNCKIVFTFICDEFTSIGGNNFGENYVIENQGVLTEFPKIESAKLNRKFLGFYTNSSFSGDEVQLPFYSDINVSLYAKWENANTSSFEIINDNVYPFIESDGVYRSTNVANNTSSTLTILANEDVTISFEYFVYGEINYDKIKIAVFNNLDEEISVLVEKSRCENYDKITYSLIKGQKIKIFYIRDLTESVGEKHIFIKNVKKGD